MAILSAQSIRERLSRRDSRNGGAIFIEPLGPDAVRSASIDVRLGAHLKRYCGGFMDDPEAMDEALWPLVGRIQYDDGEPSWRLEPGMCYLGTTLEQIAVPDDLACQLVGRSSAARRFVSLHQQAGFLDPGYAGRPTLEITVTLPILLRPGDPIGQLLFFELDARTDSPYDMLDGSRYYGDTEPTPARRPR